MTSWTTAASSRSEHGLPSTLVFDVDGTLFDTLAAIHQALNETLVRVGSAPVSLRQVRERVSPGLGGLFMSCLDESSRVREALSRSAMPAAAGASGGVAKGIPARWQGPYHAFVERYAALAPELASAYAGAGELLRTLSDQGRRLAICSNAPGAAIDRLLARAGWSGFFKVVVHADNAVQLKPSAVPLQQALGALGDVRPDDAWLIGDSEMDSRCAAAAGCGFVWFAAGYGQPHEDAPILGRIERLVELLEVARPPD